MECCVAIDRRARAKRFLWINGQGTCHARRYQGQTCHVFVTHEPGHADIFLNYCPCDEGLACQGHINGTHHINPKCIPEAEAITTTSAVPKFN